LELGQDLPASFLARDAASLRRLAADVVLDMIEFGDAPERLAGNRRRTDRGEFIEAAAHMCPTKGERDAVLVGEHPIAAIAVDLQDSAKARQVGDRSLRLSVRRIDIGDAGRVAPLPWSVITGVGPELPGLGLAAAGVEHR